MAYQFKKLSEVEALTEIPSGTNALVEVAGEIKRVPGEGLGGGGVKTAIIKASNYDSAIESMKSGVQEQDLPDVTYECLNMTFEEAYAIMEAGEPLLLVGLLVESVPYCMTGIAAFAGIAMKGEPTIGITIWGINNTFNLMWTADGVSTPEVGPS